MKKISAPIILCMLLISLTYASTTGSSAYVGNPFLPVARYNLSSNILDDFGVTNGLLKGSLAYSRLAGSVYGAVFTGNDSIYINLSDSQRLYFTNNISATMWLKPVETNERQALFCQYHAAVNQRSWCIEYYSDASTKQGMGSISLGSLDGTAFNSTRSQNNSLPLNAVSMMGFTWDSTSNSGMPIVYINGTETASYDIQEKKTTNMNNSQLNATIGRHSETAARAFNGTLGVIQLFNRSLSASQMTKEYSDNLKGIRAGDTLAASASVACTSLNKNSVYCTWVNPTDYAFNHTYLEYNTSGSAARTFVANTTGTSYNFTGLSSNQVYTFWFTATAHNDAQAGASYESNRTAVSTGSSYYLDADASGTSLTCSLLDPCKSLQNATDLLSLTSADTLYLGNGDIFRGNFLPVSNIMMNNSNGQRAKVFESVNVTSCTEITTNKWDCMKGQLPNTVNVLNYNVNSYIAGTGTESLAYRETSCTNVNANWDFCYNSTGQSILIYSSAGNPVTIGNGVEASQYQDSSGYSVAAWYLHWLVSNITISGIDFSYINERMIDALSTANISIHDVGFRWSYENSFRLRASNEPDKNRINAYNINLFMTGLKASVTSGYPGNAAEGIFTYTISGVNIKNLTAQNQYGPVFNDVNGTNIKLTNFWMNGSQYDPSLFAGIYFEGSHDSSATNGTIIREQMAGLYVGVEDSTRSVRNVSFSYLVIKAPVNKLQSMVSNPSIDYVSFDHITFMVETCNSTISQDLLYFRDHNKTNITNSLILIYCPGSYDFMYYNNTNALYSDYNDWYSTGTSYWDKITGSSLTSLSAWQSDSGNDAHSLAVDPRLISIDPGSQYFAMPATGSPVCTASKTGSYIGALPCVTSLYTSLNLSNVGNKSVTNDTITLNWTNPSYTDYNRTDIYRAGVKIGNMTTPYSELIDALLSPSTTYRYDLIPYDDYGNYGDNSTIYLTTYASNSTPAPETGFTLQNSIYRINLTFLQKPYFYSFNMTINNSNIKVYDWQKIGNQSCSDVDYYERIIGCDGTNDGDEVTYGNVIISGYGDINKTFAKYLNYTDKKVYYRSYFLQKYATTTISCLNSSGQYNELYSISTSSTVTAYDINSTIPNTCLSSDNIKIKYHYQATGASGAKIEIYENQLFSEGLYYAQFEGLTYMNLTNETSNNRFYNLTGYANNNTDENISLLFGALYQDTFNINYSYAYIYNKSINVSVLQTGTTNILNPACTFNGIVVHPKTELIYFNSSEENNITCSLSYYLPTSYVLTPGIDAINLSMSSLNMNFSVYDEETNTKINWKTVYLKVLNYNNESYEYSSSNGSISVNLGNLGDYELRYKADGYPERAYYIDIDTDAATNIKLYLLNSSSINVDYKNIKISDESDVAIGNATLQMLRFYTDCNCWQIVEMAKTSDGGKTSVLAQLYDISYRFKVYVNNDMKKYTSEYKLDTRDLYINVNLLESGIKDYVELSDGVYNQLSYDDDTGLWSYSWEDTKAIIAGGRLEVYRQTQYSKTLLFSTEASGSSGTIEYDGSSYVNMTGTFYGIGYLTTSTGNEYLVASRTMDFSNMWQTLGPPGIFISLMIVMVLALIGTFSPAASIIFTIVGFVFSKIIGLVYMDTSWLIGLVIVGFIYLFKVRE